MVLIHILSKSRDQVIGMSDYLVQERLIVDAVIIENSQRRKRSASGQIETEAVTMMIGKTKALLFSTIESKLQEKFGLPLPTLYSVPVVHMDWEQSAELIESTTKV